MKHVFLIGCLLFLAGMVSAQNDCDTAVQLLETSGECSTIDFSGASFDSFNTSCPDSSNSHNLWYYFTAEGPEIDLTASHDQGMDVYISIIRFTSGLCDPVKYTLEACGINSISNLDLLTEGSTYFVVLNVQENAGGAVDLCVDNPDITPPPVNDLPCYAQQISPDSTCVAGTTVNAEPDIENFQCSPEFTNEVWYRFELSEGLIFGVEVYLNSINLSGDVRVALVEFVNDDCNQDFFLKQQYCGSPDGFLFDYVNLNAGSTYYVAVATDPQDAGAFELCVKEMEALPHTDPCQAMDVIPNDACISFDTYYSIFEYDLPNCDFSNQKIWYQFYTGTDLNEIKIELEKIGDQENVFLGLGYFQGNWCENQFHWVDTYCGDVSGASFSAEELMPYQLYHIVVGTNFGFTGQFDLCIDGEYNSPYTNGTPCSAFNIDNLSGCIGGNSEFAGLAEQDTICYDISPVTKNWYKVDLERFDGEISVDFTALSNIPVHNIELGFFNNGCLDSFIIVNDYCGVDQVSNTVFEFADSIDYAYISVNLPNDQDYNFSICVNKLDLVENCIMNDFCSEAIDEGLVSMEQDICFTSCTFGSTQENTDEYYTSHFNTNWHKFTTADEVYELEITFQNPTTAGLFIGLNSADSCNYNSFLESRYIQLTSDQTIILDVTPNKEYNLAIAFVEEKGGSSEICIEGKEKNLCATNDKLIVQSTSMGSPLEGPFQAGETVNYCYFIESFDVVSEQSCQWLQGIIPSFGGGWSVNSFNSDGLPINSTLISSISDQVDWGWRTDVHSRVDNDYRRLSNSSLGFLDLCHVNDSNCNGEKVSQGDLLPAGWYAWNTSQGISHPDSTYGDGVSCAQANGPWHVCFSLTVGEINENNDLSIEMHTLSDGEIGLEGQADSSCMEDMPLMANYFIDCNHMIYDTAFQVLTCSENNQAVSLPDPGYYFWVSTGNERVSGIENGSGADFILNLNHNENDIQEVPYLIHAYDLNGCYVANYDVTVLVYPSLNIGREPLYTVCKEDSVQMNQVIDLQSQIIGDFEVDWMSENVNDWPNSFWKNDQSEIVPYTVISEAGCLFQDTVFFHVEDVIVSEFVEAFTICKDDSIGLNQIIDLESIIHDNFTVDWNFQDLEDVPDVITSFEKSDIIPFIIEGEAGCVYSDTLVIHVPHVDINVLGKDIYCSTDTISISAGYQFDEPHTKYWLLSEQDTIFASGFSRPASIFNPGITDLEFHLYTQEGCPFYDTETITIYQYPELTFNQDSQFLGICPYDSLLLQVSVDPNNFEIEWTTPSGNTTEKEIITNIPGWYYIESGLTNDDVSCMNTDSFHLEIYPAVETSFDFDPIVCEGDSSTISSSNPNYMFNWSIGSFSSEIMVPEGSYAVTVSNGEGCVNLFDFEITEQALPNPTFNYATEICEGDFTWISSEDSDLNYLWSNGADSSAILSYGGNYEVTITDDESCVDSFDVDVNVIQYPIVNFSFELIGDSLFLYNNSEFEGSCEWMLNDDLLEIGSDTIITLTEGDYVVSLSCSNGPCGDFALDSVSYVVVKLFEENEFNWTVYPNPTQNNFYIEFNEIKQLDEILIYNLVGQLVYSEKTNKPIKKHLIQNNLKSGVYIVEVLSGDEKGFQKITISN